MRPRCAVYDCKQKDSDISSPSRHNDGSRGQQARCTLPSTPWSVQWQTVRWSPQNTSPWNLPPDCLYSGHTIQYPGYYRSGIQDAHTSWLHSAMRHSYLQRIAKRIHQNQQNNARWLPYPGCFHLVKSKTNYQQRLSTLAYPIHKFIIEKLLVSSII